jgi:hypothetical protein
MRSPISRLRVWISVRLLVDAQAVLDAVEDLLGGKGLLEEIQRPAAHGAHHGGHFRVAGNEDDRQVDALVAQFVLQFQAAHARHAHVGHDAAGQPGQVLGEEAGGVGEDRIGQMHRLDQVGQQEGDHRVIVEQIDLRLRRFVFAWCASRCQIPDDPVRTEVLLHWKQSPRAYVDTAVCRVISGCTSCRRL